MPTKTPTLSWEQLRNYTEKFSYIDPKTGQRKVSFNPPPNAKQKEQVPYFIRYITSKGVVEEGDVITLRLNVAKRQRLVKFISSNACRWVRDYLIISVDGVRFVTH